jgi:hypothetical protein
VDDASIALLLTTAELSVAITTNVSTARVGDALHFEGLVSNGGAVGATDVVLSFEGPGGPETVNVGAIPAGGSYLFIRDYAAVLADEGLTLTGTLTVTSGGGECDFADNMGSADVLVIGGCTDTDTTCDNWDDDCDGTNDEDYAVPTSCGVGACVSTGVETCVDGVRSDTCAPTLPAPNDATCDNVDDDCDNVLDEDYQGTAACTMVGGCAGVGPTRCTGGQPVLSGVCVLVEAITDVCNGVDDDCDAQTDEDFVPEPVTCGEDACAVGSGETTCSASGVLGDSCDALWSAIPDTTCGVGTSGLNVAYIIVTDAVGKAVGSIRCAQDLAAPNTPVVCDTDTVTGELLVSTDLLCEGVTP